MRSQRLAATVLLTALLLGLLPALGVAGPAEVRLVPPDGQTAIKGDDIVGISGSADAGSTLTGAVLRAMDAAGGTLGTFDAMPYVSRVGSTLSGSFKLSCGLIPGCPDDPDVRTSIDAYRLELELDGDHVHASPDLEFDEVQPFITGYFLIRPDQIEVRFSEDVADPQGDTIADWTIEGLPPVSISGEGDRRVLHLGSTFGEDDTPRVLYRTQTGLGDTVRNEPYLDEAGNTLLGLNRWSDAADRIAPDPPTIDAIAGTATTREGGQAVPVLGSDSTPTVTVGSITDGHTAKVWLDDGDGTLEDDRDTFIGEAVASGGSAEVAWTEAPALDDGTHRFFARAVDNAACDPNDTSGPACPNASARSQDALYDLDTTPPTINDPAQASTSAVTVTLSESVTGPDATADWTITNEDGSPGPAVTGISGSGDSRVLQAEGVAPDSTLRYAPGGGRYTDDHGNELADATVGIVAQDFPVVRLVDAEPVTEQDGPPDLPTIPPYAEAVSTFRVELSEPAREGETVTVTLDVAANTATAGVDCDAAGADYVDPGEVVVELTGEETGEDVPVQLCGDTLDEFDELFELRVVSVDNAATGDDAATGKILDDDPPVGVSVADATVSEGGTAAVTVSLGAPSGKHVHVDWSLRAGTATADDDYDDVSGSVTILEGDTEATIEVPTHDDELDEADETFVVVLDRAINADVDDGEGTVTITDDDESPSLRISDLETFEGDEARTEELVVTLSEASGRDVQVDWATASDTATADDDYTDDGGTVTIPAGATSARVAIEILGDTEPESDETFTVELSNPQGADIDKGTGTVILLNDDGDIPPIELTVSGEEVGEGDGLLPPLFPAELIWTFELSRAADGPIRVDFRTTDDGTASLTEDFEEEVGTVEIPAGETTAQVTTEVIDDDLHEDDESAALVVVDPVGADLVDGAGDPVDTLTSMATILDDDPAPTVAFADGSANVAVTEGQTATFTVELSAVSGRDVTVDWATVFDGSATTDDLADQSDTVTIPAGATSETFEVTTIDNTDPDGDRTVSIELSGPSNATLGSPATSTLTIADDESVTAVITLSGGEGNEDPGLVPPLTSPTPVPFTVELSAAAEEDVTVRYRTTAGGTATAESDFTADSGTVTIPAGDTSATIEVAVLDDDLDEFDETVELELSQPVDARFPDGGPTLAEAGTIIDDDDPVTVSIGDDTSVGEGESVVVDVTLDAPSGKPVEVDHLTANQSAEGGSDYGSMSGTLRFEPGETTTQVTVQTLDDAVVEGDEDFRIELRDPLNAALGDDAAVVTITDDDLADVEENVLSMSSATQAEGDPSTLPFPAPATLDFTVSLRDPADGDVVVAWEAAMDFGEHPATAGEDFEAGDGTVTIPSGEQEATISVEVHPDLLDEFDETMTLTVTVESGNAVTPDGPLTRTGRILDDDDPAAAAFADGSSEVEVTEGDDATLTIELDTVSGKDVTVTWTTSYNGTATTADAPSQSDAVTVPAGETSATFAVETLDNDVEDGDRDFSVVLSDPQNATLPEDRPTTATVTIVDDELPVLTIEGGSVDEGATGTLGPLDPGVGLEAAAASEIRSADGDGEPGLVAAAVGPLEEDLVFTVTLAEPAEQDVTVRYRTTDAGTATAGTDPPEADYQAVSGTLTIEAGETEGQVAVDVVDDDIDEFDETVVVRFSDPQGAVFSNGEDTIDVAGTITDDDPLVTVSLGDDVDVEEGELATFGVTLDAASGKDITVRYRTQDRSATAGQDYRATDDTLTIPAGETEASFTVRTLDDGTFESTEEADVLLSVVEDDRGPTAELGRAAATLGITDNDLGVDPDDNVLSMSGDAVEEGDPLTPLGLPVARNELVFELRLREPADGAVVVDFETRAGTATAAGDFTADSGQVTIADGSDSATVAIEVVPDLIDEFDEDLRLVLTDVSGDAVLPGGQLARTGRILDDDPRAQLRVSDATVLEGDTAALDVTLDNQSGKDITVAWTLVDGTATAGDDYVADGGTLTFPAGTTSQTVQAATLADGDTGELIEQFELVLSGATNASIDDGRGTISIVDIGADGLPTTTAIFLEDEATPEGDSDHVIQVPVRLSSAHDSDITASWSTQRLTAADGEDYVGGSGDVVIPAGETEASIPITIIGDTEPERDEDFFVLLTEAVDDSGEPVFITGPTGRVTITDDDVEGGDDDDDDGPGGGDPDGAPDGDQGAGQMPATGGGIGLGMIALAALLARRRRD